MSSPTPSSAIPSRLGRYEIQAELGRGSMGVVYLARDPLIGRLVALKVFRPNLAADAGDLERFRSRFLREAQSAGILSHPNIVTVHDVVDEGEEGVVFIAMEYVQGTNLKELLRYGKPLELSQVLDAVRQVASAIDYAHSRRVVHRDVKPANVLLTPERQVKITDFGIAQFDTTSLTHDGQLLGTPNYMSPEQVQGREVDRRTDLFSLGVVLYEMITRHKPFAGESLTAVSHRIVYDAYTPPEEYTGSLPPGVSEIFPRALAKDPAERYPTAQALADDLARAVEVYERDVALSDTQDLPAADDPRPPPDDDEHDTLPGIAPPPPPPPAADGRAGRSEAGGPLARRVRPALAATGAFLARAGPADRPPRRRLAIVAASTAAVALAAVAGLLLFAMRVEPGDDLAAYGPEHRLEVEYLSLMRQGRRAAAADDPVAAAVAFRRAESLRPDRPVAHRLRVLSEREAGELQADAFRRRQLDLQAAAAAAALAGRRYQEALATASVVLEVEPDNEEAARLVRQARVGLAREAARRNDAVAQAEPEDAGEERVAESLPAPEPGPAVAPEDGFLDVRLVAEGEGRLMVRVGDELVANNPYDFYEREGLFRRKRPVQGRHEVQGVRLEPGTHDVRFWVTPVGLAARTDEVTIDLQPGGSRTLRLYLSPDKELTWALE